MLTTENTDPTIATTGDSAKYRGRGWSAVTMVSISFGLASAGLLTAAMFWIGNYYRDPQPSKDEDGRAKLWELRASEQKELQTYGWINQTAGVVRVPIDRAMQLLIEEGQREKSSPLTTSGDGPPAK